MYFPVIGIYLREDKCFCLHFAKRHTNAAIYRFESKVAPEALSQPRISLPRPGRKHIFSRRLNDSAVEAHDGDGLIYRVQAARVIEGSPAPLLGAAGEGLRRGLGAGRVGSEGGGG